MTERITHAAPERRSHDGRVSLDTPFFDGHERKPIQAHAPPQQAYSRWLSVNEIRKMERMRRETVIEAMASGELPYEQRGRIRYARLSDVLLWEDRRLAGTTSQSTHAIDPDFADLAFGPGGRAS